MQHVMKFIAGLTLVFLGGLLLWATTQTPGHHRLTQFGAGCLMAVGLFKIIDTGDKEE